MGKWIYVGKKEVECPNCHKVIETEVRIKYKDKV